MSSATSSQNTFFNLHTHGFVRCAVCIPRVQVGDTAANLAYTLELITHLSPQSPSLMVFPELGLSAYAIDDLVQQAALLNGVEESVSHLLEATRESSSLIFVGAPVRVGEGLYNTALALYRGRLLAGFPKTYLPNYREFYEKRYFSSGAYSIPHSLTLAGHEATCCSNIL